MASENTHIYLVDRTRREIKDHVLKRVISDRMDYYFLGSIFPDINRMEINGKKTGVHTCIGIMKQVWTYR